MPCKYRGVKLWSCNKYVKRAILSSEKQENKLLSQKQTQKQKTPKRQWQIMLPPFIELATSRSVDSRSACGILSGMNIEVFTTYPCGDWMLAVSTLLVQLQTLLKTTKKPKVFARFPLAGLWDPQYKFYRILCLHSSSKYRGGQDHDNLTCVPANTPYIAFGNFNEDITAVIHPHSIQSYMMSQAAFTHWQVV